VGLACNAFELRTEPTVKRKKTMATPEDQTAAPGVVPAEAAPTTEAPVAVPEVATEAPGQDVAVQAPAGVPMVHDYGDDAGAGFEGVTSDDLSIPFLMVLQSNSPQVEDQDPKGAASGMLFNSVTRSLIAARYDDNEAGMVFVPVYKQNSFVEWVPDRGGFVAVHSPDEPEVKAAIAAIGGQVSGPIPFGDNELVQTVYVYGLTLDAEGKESQGFGVLPFTSTKLKPRRDWWTAMLTIKGGKQIPLFAHRVRIRTVKQENDKGKFYNLRIEPLSGAWGQGNSLIDPKTESQLLTDAKDFLGLVESGAATAAYETLDGNQDGSGGGTAPAGGTQTADGEEIPF
jgi:hypothetical protein